MSVSENKHNHYLHIAIIVLIIINIVINVVSIKSAENIEIMKVGWQENYEKLQVIMGSDAYKEQYAQNLELMLQQIQGWWTEEVIPEDTTLSTWTETIDTTSGSFDTNEWQGE